MYIAVFWFLPYFYGGFLVPIILGACADSV